MVINHNNISYEFSVIREPGRKGEARKVALGAFSSGGPRFKPAYLDLHCHYGGKHCSISIEEGADIEVEAARIIERFATEDPTTDRKFWESQIPKIAKLLR